MNNKQEKRIIKFLKKLARNNSEYRYLYDVETGRIYVDGSQCKNVFNELYLSVRSLQYPFGYDVELENNLKSRITRFGKILTSVNIVTEAEKAEALLDEDCIEYHYVMPSFTRTFNNIKNKVKYFFTKRKKVTEDDLRYDFTKDTKESEEPKRLPERTSNKTATLGIDGITPEEPIMRITPVEPVTPTEPVVEPTEPVVEPTEPVVEPVKPVVSNSNSEKVNNSKLVDLIVKERQKELYNELGEFEKMFIDDATAEGLEYGDQEFNMMLNERAVSKKAITNYFEQIKEFRNSIKEDELEFVEDAIADNLEYGDSELNMMANYRCVNNDKVMNYMRLYKELLNKQRELAVKYKNSISKDYESLRINELRREISDNKTMLTKPELDKQKTSSLKKNEIIEILDRIDSRKADTESRRTLGL